MPGNDLVQSLTRGLDILALLAKAEGGMRIKDISAQLELNATTVHNLVRTLRAKDFVRQENSSTIYSIGPRLAELAEMRQQKPFIKRAEEAMKCLSETLPGATVIFAEPADSEVMVRRRMSADRPGEMQSPEGLTFTVYCSASGLAMLAFGREDQILSLRQRHPLLEEGAPLWASPEKLEAYLEDARRKGYALHPHANDKNFTLAMPVYGREALLAAALGISLTSANAIPDTDREEVMKALSDATQSLSASQSK